MVTLTATPRLSYTNARDQMTGAALRDVPSWLAGVTLFGGNDGIRDTWTPYGSPDMLERALLIAMRHDLRRDDDLALAFDCVSRVAADACGFSAYGLHAGARADLGKRDRDDRRA